ncbi:hypothetical protein VTO73DRAFT_266 [Trametes versicolor]
MPPKPPKYAQGPFKNHLLALQTGRRAQNSGSLMRPSIFPKADPDLRAAATPAVSRHIAVCPATTTTINTKLQPMSS